MLAVDNKYNIKYLACKGLNDIDTLIVFLREGFEKKMIKF